MTEQRRTMITLLMMFGKKLQKCHIIRKASTARNQLHRGLNFSILTLSSDIRVRQRLHRGKFGVANNINLKVPAQAIQSGGVVERQQDTRTISIGSSRSCRLIENDKVTIWAFTDKARSGRATATKIRLLNEGKTPRKGFWCNTSLLEVGDSCCEELGKHRELGTVVEDDSCG